MKILLCVEDDPALETVLGSLDWSVELSRWDEIVVLHAVPHHSLFPVRNDAPRAFLDRISERIDPSARSLETMVVSGDPAEEILRVAEERDVDLVILGAHGGWRDFLMGSVSARVVGLTKTDVLVVRERGPREERGQRFHALLAVDGSRGSEAGIGSFVRKLRAHKAVIRLVHVVESLPSIWEMGNPGEELPSSFAEQARGVLSRALRILGECGLEAECEWRQGSPAAQILEAARIAGSDVVVVGSRGHSGLRELMLGSITQRILRHAPCSVFCAKAWEPESALLREGWSSEEWEPHAGLA